MKKLVLALLLLPAIAFAQQAGGPQEQIERTIGNLFITNTNLAAQVAQLQAEVKRLKDKYEPEQPPKKD